MRLLPQACSFYQVPGIQSNGSSRLKLRFITATCCKSWLGQCCWEGGPGTVSVGLSIITLERSGPGSVKQAEGNEHC